MAITFVAAGTLGSAGSGNPTAPGLPAGWAAGDIHVLLVSAADNVVVTLPAGWTKKLETNGGTALRQTVAWRRAVGGDTAPTVTHAAGDGVLARIYGYRGCTASGDPIEAIGAQANAATATCTAPAITPLNSNAAILFLGCEELTNNTSGAPTWGTFSGTNPTFAQVGGTGDASGLGVNDIGQNVAWGLKTDTTSTGSRTAVISGEAATPTENIGCLLALTPLGAAGAGQSPPLVFVPRVNPFRLKRQRPFISALRRAFPSAATTSTLLVTGTGAGVGGSTGNLTEQATITGTAAGVGGSTGTIAQADTLTGTAAGTGGSAGTLASGDLLTGSAAGAGGSTGTLAATDTVTASSAGIGGSTGTLSATDLITGVSAGVGGSLDATSGSHMGAVDLVTGSSAGVGGGTGTLSAANAITGASAGVGGGTGLLSVQPDQSLVGQVGGGGGPGWKKGFSRVPIQPWPRARPQPRLPRSLPEPRRQRIPERIDDVVAFAALYQAGAIDDQELAALITVANEE